MQMSARTRPKAAEATGVAAAIAVAVTGARENSNSREAVSTTQEAAGAVSSTSRAMLATGLNPQRKDTLGTLLVNILMIKLFFIYVAALLT